MITLYTCTIVPKQLKFLNSNTRFYGVGQMSKDSFEKNEQNGYKVDYLTNMDEYEGYVSFFIPNKDETLQARYLINDSENPPCYRHDDIVKGDFTIDINEINKVSDKENLKIAQNPQHTFDTNTDIIGIITNKDNNDITISAEGVKVGAFVPEPENFNIGDRIAANGNLEFSFD